MKENKGSKPTWTYCKRAYKWGVQDTENGTTIDEIKNQIQEDLMTYLDGIDEHLGNPNEELLNECLQIVIDNFNTLKNK